jgi:hypothetical protein
MRVKLVVNFYIYELSFAKKTLLENINFEKYNLKEIFFTTGYSKNNQALENIEYCYFDPTLNKNESEKWDSKFVKS